MAKKKYEEANIQAIADTIREKTGTEQTYTTEEMASGVNEVYEAGKQAQYDEFWDAFQSNGTRTLYERCFYYNWWDDTTFKPKYSMPVKYALQMFSSCRIKDLAGILRDRGITIDFSTATGMQQVFQASAITVIPELNIPLATTIAQMCQNCSQLTTIEKIVIGEKTTVGGTTAFTGCSALANITFEGTIVLSLNFSASPLTVESMKSIISCLKNYAGTDKEYSYTITFSSACLTALDAEGNTSPNGNLWRDYVGDLGWNC